MKITRLVAMVALLCLSLIVTPAFAGTADQSIGVVPTIIDQQELVMESGSRAPPSDQLCDYTSHNTNDYVSSNSLICETGADCSTGQVDSLPTTLCSPAHSDDSLLLHQPDGTPTNSMVGLSANGNAHFDDYELDLYSATLADTVALLSGLDPPAVTFRETPAVVEAGRLLRRESGKFTGFHIHSNTMKRSLGVYCAPAHTSRPLRI